MHLITPRHTTLGGTALDKWSARRRDLSLTTHNTTDIHAPAGIRTHNPGKRVTTDPRLRSRGQEKSSFISRTQYVIRYHTQVSDSDFFYSRCDVRLSFYVPDGLADRSSSLSSSSSSSCSWRVRHVSCSLILKMKLVSPSLPRSSYVPSSFWFIL